MPIAVKRIPIEGTDVSGIHYNLPSYYVFVFRKEIPIILFYLSKGLDYALDYLGVSEVVKFTDEAPTMEETDNNVVFQLSNKCYMYLDREMFNKHTYIQSIAGMFLTVCTNRVTVEQLQDPKQWIKKISNPNNYDKGYSILKYFNRLMDETTSKVLKLPDFYTRDIYGILKWMISEYNTLRMKDNCNLENKRLRCNEYIAALLTKEFSKRLNRIISLGEKVTIDNIRELFKFAGDILIQKMHKMNVPLCSNT